MAAKQRPVANPVHENFEPSTEWSREPTADALIVFLPGFKKEQLKVQVTSTSKLRISGERPIGVDKWSRFEKELQIPSNCNTNEISAKFERGSLSIRLPKNIAPAAPAETQKPIAEAPKPQEQLPKQDLKPEPPTVSPIPQKPPQEKSQPPRESVPKPTNHQTPQAPKNKKQEEAGVEEAVPKTSTDKPKTENNVPKKAAEEKKESPSDHEKDNAAKVDKTTGGTVSGSGKPTLVQNYKQVLGGLMVEMKKPKKLMNLVVVVLLIAVIVLSANRAIRYLVKFNTNEATSSDDQA